MLQILKLSSSYCAPCRALIPIIQQVKQEMNLDVISYDADEHESVFTQYNVRAVPTLIFLKNGLEVARKTGMMTKDALVKTIEELK